MYYSQQDLEKDIDELEMDKLFLDAAQEVFGGKEELDDEELLVLAACIGIKGADKFVKIDKK